MQVFKNYVKGADRDKISLSDDTINIIMSYLVKGKSEIVYDCSTGPKGIFEVYNSAGQLVFTNSSPTDGEYFTLDVDMTPYMDAMYVVRLATEKEMVGGKFFKK